jgi:hypothetical protein
MRVWLDWARNAVVTNKAEKQRDSADIFGPGQAASVGLGQGASARRDHLGPDGAAVRIRPAGLGSAAGQRVNGLLYQDATAGQRNTWNSDNSDRVLYGNATTNYNATHATALANCDTTNDTFTSANLSLLKRIAMNAVPKIRPFKTKDGYEYSWRSAAPTRSAI